MDSTVTAAIVSLLIALIGVIYNEIRFRRQNRAETAIKELLGSEGWKRRTFDAIKKRIGGYDDDGLRRLLVRSGAIRFHRKSDNVELWGLLEKNKAIVSEDLPSELP